MKIIIVGCGKVGMNLAERLSTEEGQEVVALDTDHKVVVEASERFDIMGVTGSGISADSLIEAGVENADILIAVTGSDELNLLICLIARKSGSCKTIARVRKPEYSKALHMFKEDLGLAMIINPQQAAASEIARVLRLPSAIQIDTFAKGRTEILKFKLEEGSVLDNMRVCEIGPRLNCDVLVCGVEREDKVFIPRGDFVLKGGDFISIVASYKNGAYFFKKIGIKTNKVKNTIIVGGGDIAYYLAKQLVQTGIAVKIIDNNPQVCDRLCQALPEATIINGDGTDNRLLLQEGLEYADSFVALTNIDEENVLLSLFAKSKSDAKLVTKINRIAYDEVINNLELGTTVYPKNITTEYIVRFVRAKKNSIGSNIETMHYILDGKAEALEFRIGPDSPVVNIPIQDLRLKKDVLLASINRNSRIFIPRGQDIIAEGDTVIVVTTLKGFKDISDILE